MVYTNTSPIVVEQFCFIFDGKDLSKGKKVELYELSFEGSPESSAISISKKETEIYQSLNLDGRIYTLFVGPMEYAEGTLRVRIGIATGIHRR
tara:strand:+ start:1778 stop:2056 length:279 start_codon:yes stop_codon:yes gene_type:complete